MKKLFSLAALGLVAWGSTLWAQQDGDQAPAKAGDSTPAQEDPVLAEAAPPVVSSDTPWATPTTRLVKPSTARPIARTATPGTLGVPPQFMPAVGAPTNVTPGQPVYGVNAAGSAYPYGPPAYGYSTAPGVNTPQGVWHLAPGPNGEQYYTQRSLEDLKNEREFRETVAALRKATTDEEKAEIRNKLNELVSTQIDQDLVERETRLAELESRARQLREQLQQRKQNKAEIQKMLVMLIENPQGGLGLPASWLNAINQPAYPTTNYQTTPMNPLNANSSYRP